MVYNKCSSVNFLNGQPDSILLIIHRLEQTGHTVLSSLITLLPDQNVLTFLGTYTPRKVVRPTSFFMSQKELNFNQLSEIADLIAVAQSDDVEDQQRIMLINIMDEKIQKIINSISDD